MSPAQARAQLRRWQMAMLEELVVAPEAASPSCLEAVADDLLAELRGQYPKLVRDALARHLPLFTKIAAPLGEAELRRASPRFVETCGPAQVVTGLYALARAAAVAVSELESDALLIDRARGLARAHVHASGPAVAAAISAQRPALAELGSASASVSEDSTRDLGSIFAVRLATNLVEHLGGLDVREAVTLGWERWFVFFAFGPGPSLGWVELAELRRAELHLAFADGWSL